MLSVEQLPPYWQEDRSNFSDAQVRTEKKFGTPIIRAQKAPEGARRSLGGGGWMGGVDGMTWVT